MKIAIVGYGRMGRAVESVAEERGHRVVARLDAPEGAAAGGVTPERLGGAELAIEFSVAEAAPGNIMELADCGVDIVAGTTGWYGRLSEVQTAVEAAGVGLIYAPNFSLGTQIFFRLAERAATLVDRVGGYDAYVLEAHHRHKRDHPSGTATKLAEALLSALSSKRDWSLGSPEGAIDPAVLQVSSVRAGEIPGTHRVGFEGPHDRIVLEHEARGRSGFAQGAVRAAEWIRGRQGTFTLDDMLAELWR